jgi:hypothetical protein
LAIDQDLEQRNEIAAPAFDRYPFLGLWCGAPWLQAMTCRAVPRQEHLAAGALRRNAAKLWRLVLNFFSHYLLLERKSDVYDVIFLAQ